MLRVPQPRAWVAMTVVLVLFPSREGKRKRDGELTGLPPVQTRLNHWMGGDPNARHWVGGSCWWLEVLSAAAESLCRMYILPDLRKDVNVG